METSECDRSFDGSVAASEALAAAQAPVRQSRTRLSKVIIGVSLLICRKRA
jgi:hypothetical protein